MVKYDLKNGEILKDGHTMFLQDVVKDLNRKAYLEDVLLSAQYSFHCMEQAGAFKQNGLDQKMAAGINKKLTKAVGVANRRA